MDWFQSNRHNARPNKKVNDDLKLAWKFLDRANKGVNMNLLNSMKPEIVYICDVYENDLGGFASHGKAWTYTIHIYLRNRAHINI